MKDKSGKVVHEPYVIKAVSYTHLSWKLEPTDKLPKGKKPCLSLRELEKDECYGCAYGKCGPCIGICYKSIKA